MLIKMLLNIFKAKKDSKKNDEFAEISNLAYMSFKLAFGPYEYNNYQFSNKQIENLYAFELGILEWYMKNLLTKYVAEEDILVKKILFLSYYANFKYKEKSNVLDKFWSEVILSESYLNVRELGYRSISESFNKEGHAPEVYFEKAINCN